MDTKQLKEIFSKIDISDNEHHLQIIHSKDLKEMFYGNYFENDISLEVEFLVYGHFTTLSNFKLDEIQVKRVDFWLDDYTEYKLNSIENELLLNTLYDKVKSL